MATESDNVNSGALGTLLSVGTIAFFGIALVVTALVRSEMSEEQEKKEVSADRPYRDLVAEQKAKMDAPAAYVPGGSGRVSLPIERAMELTVSSLKKDPNSATPPAAAGSGGGAAEAATGGSGGTSGASAESGGTGGGEAAPPNEAVHAEGGKPSEEPKKEGAGDKKDEKKKEGAKPKPVPAAPAPVPAAPAPAPAPNP